MNILGGALAFLGMIVSAFAGGGGALLMLLALLWVFPEVPYLSMLTIAKVAAAVMTATAGFLHYEKQPINWRFLGLGVIIPGTLGVLASTYILTNWMDPEWMVQVIPYLVLFIGLALLLDWKKGLGGEKERSMSVHHTLVSALFFFVLNVANGAVGGLGILATAYMVSYMRMSFLRATAYVMISGVFINTIQSSYLLWTVDVDLGLMAWVCFGSLLGAFAGTKLQYLKGNRYVKIAAVTLMFGMGMKMLIF